MYLTIQNETATSKSPLWRAKTVAHYAIIFRILAAESGWDKIFLQNAFILGLSEEIKDDTAEWMVNMTCIVEPFEESVDLKAAM